MLLFAVLALREAEPAFLQQAQPLIFDAWQRAFPRPYVATGVRIVDLDDESLARLGQWPWPRVQVADMVARLSGMGAAAIGFDIVFAEPDRTSPNAVLALWRKTGGLTADLAGPLSALPDHDDVLAKAMNGANVVTGFVLGDESTSRLPAVKAGFSHAGDDPRPSIPAYQGAVATLAPLERDAAGNGSFNFLPGLDGVVRRVPLLLRVGDQIYPTLVAELLRVAQGARGYIVKSTGASGEYAVGGAARGIVAVKVGRIEVPTDAGGQVRLHFARAPADRAVPAWTVFEPDFDSSLIEGHIVLIGTSAAGLRDLRPTPLDRNAAGVSVHAEALEQILTGGTLLRPTWADGAERAFVVVLSLSLILLLPRAGALWCTILGGVGIAGAFGFSVGAFTQYRLLVDPVFPSAAAFAVYLSAATSGYLRTEAERRQVRSAFAHYLAPALVDQLARHPDQLKLGGETKEMTLLFCDVRGFTSISELYKTDPHGLTRLMNRLLTPLTDVILARQGTIDKYMGDCIMAFWNAPLDVPGHAAHACDAALAMFIALEAVNEQRKREAAETGLTYIDLKIGIGINTGTCVVGNMGSDQRFDYSVLGDAVNLASRLEGQSKNYGVGVVLGPDTAVQAADRFAVLELDQIAVKGKKEAVRIFTVYGDAAVRADPAFAALRAVHDAMLLAYRAQDWDGAAARIKECRGLSGGRIAGFYDLYEERIAEFRANPPGGDWDGVYRATSK